jgi:hypothetical protein
LNACVCVRKKERDEVSEAFDMDRRNPIGLTYTNELVDLSIR